MDESISLPATSIPPVAAAIASSRKSVAAVMFLLALLFVIAMVGVAVDGPHSTMGHRQDPSTMIAGIGFWVIVLAALGASSVRKARRVAEAGRLASCDPSYTWFLTGSQVVAIAADGAPRPNLSFKVSRRLREMLTVVPRARVV